MGITTAFFLILCIWSLIEGDFWNDISLFITYIVASLLFAIMFAGVTARFTIYVIEIRSSEDKISQIEHIL
jgi:hypothetical protein